MKAKQRGASMVEFALILPGFLLLMCLVIYGGMWMYAQNTLNEIARNSVRYGAVEAAANTQSDVEYGEERPASNTIRTKNVIKVATEAASESLILYSIDTSKATYKDNLGAKAEVVTVNNEDSIQVELKAGLIEDNLPPLIDGFLPDYISSKMIMRIEK